MHFLLTWPFRTLVMKAVLRKVLNINSISDSPVMLKSPIFCFTWPPGIPKKVVPEITSNWVGGLTKVFSKHHLYKTIFNQGNVSNQMCAICFKECVCIRNERGIIYYGLFSFRHFPGGRYFEKKWRVLVVQLSRHIILLYDNNWAKNVKSEDILTFGAFGDSLRRSGCYSMCAK